MNNITVSCPHTTTVLITKKETYKVKGEPITIEAQVTYCKDCNQEIFDPKIDDHNLQTAYAIYRKKHNLLRPEEIILLREHYNLDQEAFANLIGCSSTTIVIYENGAIPDENHNQTFKLLKNKL